MTATGFLNNHRWTEETLDQISREQKITKVSAQYTFSGQLEGKSDVEYLLYYKNFNEKSPVRSQASYIGLFRFEGTLAGKKGSFVMMDKGAFEDGEARSELKILSGSGTGALESISGLGRYTTTPDSSLIELRYTLHAGRGQAKADRAA